MKSKGALVKIKDNSDLFNECKDAFRLETLSVYSIPEEEKYLQLYYNGKPLPPQECCMTEWHTMLTKAKERGASFKRLRSLPESFNNYIRAEIEWGYIYNAEFGENIRMITPSLIKEKVSKEKLVDFWIFDNASVLLMNYDTEGHFLGSNLVDDFREVDKYIKIKELLWPLGQKLEDFLKEYRAKKY